MLRSLISLCCPTECVQSNTHTIRVTQLWTHSGSSIFILMSNIVGGQDLGLAGLPGKPPPQHTHTQDYGEGRQIWMLHNPELNLVKISAFIWNIHSFSVHLCPPCPSVLSLTVLRLYFYCFYWTKGSTGVVYVYWMHASDRLQPRVHCVSACQTPLLSPTFSVCDVFSPLSLSLTLLIFLWLPPAVSHTLH